jgi:hypothetical protein
MPQVVRPGHSCAWAPIRWEGDSCLFFAEHFAPTRECRRHKPSTGNLRSRRL